MASQKRQRVYGTRPDMSANGWSVFFLFVKLSLTPAIIFSFVSIIFMMGYHLMPKMLMVVGALFVLLFLFLSFEAYIQHPDDPRRSLFTVQAWMYAVFAVAVLSGGAVGTSISVTKLTDYWPYDLKRHYTNVAPEEPAGSKADASAIVFMDGAKPDGTRAQAYHRYGSDWCVAPISLDASYSDSLKVQTDIQYWAVGQDCCKGHLGFNCDASQTKGARSGLVLQKMSRSDQMMKGLSGTGEMSYYEEAILMGTSKFDITTPKNHLLVRFVDDLESARMTYFGAAWATWWHMQFSFGLVWGVAGIIAVVLSQEAYKKSFGDMKSNALTGINSIM